MLINGCKIMETDSLYFDLHVHSIYSHDSTMKPETIIKHSLKRGLSGVAITDHNTIQGAIATDYISNDDFIIIIGAEIITEKGEIIGLFLNEEIKSNDFYNVIDEIKGQGGLIIFPHPFKKGVKNQELLVKEVDMIEVLNARIKPEMNNKACLLAEEFNLPITAGSDAHTFFEIGNVRNRLPIDELCIEEIRKTLIGGSNIPIGRESPLYIRMLSKGIGRYNKDGVSGLVNSIHKVIKNGFLS